MRLYLSLLGYFLTMKIIHVWLNRKWDSFANYRVSFCWRPDACVARAQPVSSGAALGAPAVNVTPSLVGFPVGAGLDVNISPRLRYQEQSQRFPCYSVDSIQFRTLFTYFPGLITFVYLESAGLTPLCQASAHCNGVCGCRYIIFYVLSNSVCLFVGFFLSLGKLKNIG